MSLDNFKSILVLAPHTDDGELGAGGFLSKLAASGSEILYVAFSTAKESLPHGLAEDTLFHEVQNAIKEIGINNIKILDYPVRNFQANRQSILEDIIKVRNSNNFDLVLLPASSDIHQDHQVIHNEGIRAFKNITILGYELIWNSFDFRNHLYVRLDEKDIVNKAKALNHYKSQSHRNYMSEEFVRSLAYTRGLQINHKFSECFEVIRWVLD